MHVQFSKVNFCKCPKCYKFPSTSHTHLIMLPLCVVLSCQFATAYNKYAVVKREWSGIKIFWWVISECWRLWVMYCKLLCVWPDTLRLLKLFDHRMPSRQRNEAQGSHQMQRMWLQDNVQEENEKRWELDKFGTWISLDEVADMCCSLQLHNPIPVLFPSLTGRVWSHQLMNPLSKFSLQLANSSWKITMITYDYILFKILHLKIPLR